LQIFDGKTFWVVNVHFSIEKIAIFNSIKLLPSLIFDVIDENDLVIIGGDFNNCFKYMFEEFENQGIICVSENMLTKCGKAIDFTYIGERIFGQIYSNQLLDYFFIRSTKDLKYDVTIPLTLDQIEKSYISSDHLPLVMTIQI
jgi:endonuclease/exonuclease/phosphatase family metal-dependent hydrolase